MRLWWSISLIETTIASGRFTGIGIVIRPAVDAAAGKTGGEFDGDQ
jgi:hypothetical protein